MAAGANFGVIGSRPSKLRQYVQWLKNKIGTETNSAPDPQKEYVVVTIELLKSELAKT